MATTHVDAKTDLLQQRQDTLTMVMNGLNEMRKILSPSWVPPEETKTCVVQEPPSVLLAESNNLHSKNGAAVTIVKKETEFIKTMVEEPETKRTDPTMNQPSSEFENKQTGCSSFDLFLGHGTVVATVVWEPNKHTTPVPKPK